MSTGCDPVRLSLGAYALDTLEPADRHAVEAHLAGCPVCRAELAELASVVPALATLDATDLARPVPSEDLFARISSAARATEVPATESHTTPETDVRPAPSRWRARRLLAVAAAVVVLGGAATGIGLAVSSDSSRPATSVASAQAGGVRLKVTASDADQGTRLVLAAQGLPEHERCHLVAIDAAGKSHEAGRWNADYSGTAQVVESTDVARSDLRQLVLYGTQGQHLLTVDV